jgi:hypothetical protein
LNDINVLIVGLEPAAPGEVLTFSIADPSYGGTKLFRLNTIKAFLTGSIPTD